MERTEIFSLNFLSLHFSVNVTLLAPEEIIDKGGWRVLLHLWVAGGAPPPGTLPPQSHIPEHADPQRRADTSQALSQTNFWSIQSVQRTGEWRLKIVEIRGG